MTDSGNAIDPIERIAARGDGVSRSGRHVAMAVPGDWLDEAGVLHHGPSRQPPSCPHFGQCGGCQLQHADDGALAQFVRDRVINALMAQNITCTAVEQAYLSPPATRRRTNMRVQRTGPKLRMGYAERASNRLVDIRDCAVLHPELMALIAPLKGLMLALIGPRDVGSVQLTLIDQGVDVLITGTQAQGLAAHDAIVDFCTAQAIARLAVDGGDGPEDRWAPEPASVSFGKVAVPAPHAPFLQATHDGEAQLINAVQAAIGGSTMTADLFSGIGTFALSMPDATSVHAVEASRDAIMALTVAAQRHQRRVTAEHRDLYRRPLTVNELSRFDAVILDPPRAGAAEQVAMLADSKVANIAYVSCNPTSFARDAAQLIRGGYQLNWVRPVGQFRWSTHVELAASFKR